MTATLPFLPNVQAAQKIADLLAASRANDSGQKLEVNEKILDSCTSLVRAIRSVKGNVHIPGFPHHWVRYKVLNIGGLGRVFNFPFPIVHLV